MESGGEDAFFISRVGCGALGVADGVGGWAEEGVDASAYSRGLMLHAAQALEGSGGCEGAVGVLAYAQVGWAGGGGGQGEGGGGEGREVGSMGWGQCIAQACHQN